MSDFQDTGSEITSTMAGCLRGTIAVSASITISAAAGLSVGMSKTNCTGANNADNNS